MPAINLTNINNFICRDINLEIADKELLVLLGPTGAGKTTLLNIIAGLIPYQGTISFDGTPIDELAPNRRGVGYLFQDLALFPHLDVATNIAYGLGAQGMPREEAMIRVDELLRLMKIGHLSSRYPKNLSGGEKQRVALARALAPFPSVLLLDEPLNSMDFRTSRYLRMEFRRLQKGLGITTLYVTHNLAEAEEMSDRVAIIYNGKLEQVGVPHEVFLEPENERVSDFLGTPNILDCEYCRVLGEGLVEAGCGGIRIVVPHEGDRIRRIAISPGHIYVFREKPPGPDLNRFKGAITEIIPSEFLARFRVKVGENILLAELPQDIFEDLELAAGKEVYLVLKLKWINVMSSNGGSGCTRL